MSIADLDRRAELEDAARAAFAALLDTDPVAAYHFREGTFGAMRDAAYPRLTVELEPETPDEYGYHYLRCPHCGARLLTGDPAGCGLQVEDVAYRWTAAHDLDDDDLAEHTVTVSYGGSADFEGYVYRCDGCNNPVRLPEDWTEANA